MSNQQVFRGALGYRISSSRLIAAVITALVVVTACSPAQAQGGRVIISEIHYRDPQGTSLDFVEIENTGSAPVDIGGWAFVEGIRHEFAPGTVIAPGGREVVCRDPDALATRFGLAAADLHQWIGSGLSGGGEEVTLADASGVVVDRVRYDDEAPWPLAADGGGPSLQRFCATAPSGLPANWGAPMTGPTPLEPNPAEACPPPPLPAPAVAINEIYYHPALDRDAELEFVELVNTTDAAIDLDGYCFSQGLGFCFAEGDVLAPRAFVVVARNAEALREHFRIDNVVGDFIGQLSNDGERITLIDPEGRLVDSVRYGDSGDWSPAADSLGFSLEKITPRAPSDDPASWNDSGSADSLAPDTVEWETVTLTGQGTSDRVIIHAGGPGEFLIDDISLVRVDDPDRNLLANGDFETGVEPWELRGNHSDSRWSRADDGGPVFERGALHLISRGRGSSSSSVRVDATESIDRSGDVTYQLRFSFAHLTGEKSLTVRLSLATPSRGLYFRMGGTNEVVSPGEKNLIGRPVPPPFVTDIQRSPRQPTSADPVTITASVRGGATSVRLLAELAGGPVELDMRDDGASGDGEAGDGIYGVELPPQPHDTPVIFKIEAASETDVRTFPGRSEPQTHHGYYVNDNVPDSPLPIYTMILPTNNPRAWIAALNCTTYRPCSFAVDGDLYYNIGIRRRGGSVCGDPDVIKKFMKLKFHRGQLFEGQLKLNLQSLWTDKSLIRENMSWKVFEEMGEPACEHYYIRLHANGEYFGLYAGFEHPDSRFLERVGLNPAGNLYKATASREEANGTYEKKTNEREGMEDLREFLRTMHGTPRTQLTEFFEERMDGDSVIAYQASQILINNRDYPHKNHYLYHDTATGKWSVTAWDLDLSYGKRWDGNFEGVLNDQMDNPGISPWHTTNVRGDGLGNHLLDKFFSQSGDYYRRAYVVRLWGAIHERYTLDFYERKIQAYQDLLMDEQDEDIRAWGRSRASANDRAAPAAFLPNLDRVRDHIRIRRGFLINYLRSRERFEGHDRMMITEIMYNSASGSETEFLELWNNSGRAIDASGWSIEGIGYSFPEGTTIGDSEVIVVAKNPALLQSLQEIPARVFGPYRGDLDNRGEELRVKDAGPGHPATVDRVRYDDRAPWPRRADGFGYSLELVDVEADMDSAAVKNWSISAEIGGSPGRVAGISVDSEPFRRGDCDADGAVTISDVVSILRFIFRGDMSPTCLAGCDLDGDAGLAVDDAIVLLGRMFMRSEVQIPFPGPTECAPVAGAQCEVSNCAAP